MKWWMSIEGDFLCALRLTVPGRVKSCQAKPSREYANDSPAVTAMCLPIRSHTIERFWPSRNISRTLLVVIDCKRDSNKNVPSCCQLTALVTWLSISCAYCALLLLFGFSSDSRSLHFLLSHDHVAAPRNLQQVSRCSGAVTQPPGRLPIRAVTRSHPLDLPSQSARPLPRLCTWATRSHVHSRTTEHALLIPSTINNRPACHHSYRHLHC